MPSYTIRNKITEEEWDVVCSWDELQEILQENSDLTQKVSSPKIVTMVGGTLSRTSGDWKNFLTKMKKSSGRNNTIKD